MEVQGEVGRLIKKVNRHCDAFETIWKKFGTDAGQKKKAFSDLKKEVLKLQKVRDEMTRRIQSSKILDDALNLVEQQMKRFKEAEAGFLQPEMDAKKAGTKTWVRNAVLNLEYQIRCFEEDMLVPSDKKDKESTLPKMKRLEVSIKRHKAHILKLKLILELLDGDKLTPNAVDDIQIVIEAYVEKNQYLFDCYADVDYLYMTLPLVNAAPVQAREAYNGMLPPEAGETLMKYIGETQQMLLSRSKYSDTPLATVSHIRVEEQATTSALTPHTGKKGVRSSKRLKLSC